MTESVQIKGITIRPGDWVARLKYDSRQPRIAKVKELYDEKGFILFDLIFYDHDGTKIGRASPACGGPRTFEPCCELVEGGWVKIEPPDFDYLAKDRYEWGHKLKLSKD